MTQSKPVVEVVPLGFYSSLELARWAAVAHEEVVHLADEGVVRLASPMDINREWMLLNVHFQKRTLRDDAGQLHEGYVLSRAGLLYVLKELPDSARVQELRKIAARVTFYLLRVQMDELAAAFDARAAQTMGEEVQA